MLPTLLLLSLANLVSFSLFTLDKARARAGGRRIPERTLLHALADVLAARPELYETPNPERPRPERTTR